MVTIRVVVNVKVIPDKAVNAYYMLSNPQGQITSYAMNVLRGMLALHTLDEVFLMRSEIQKHLKTELDQQLEQYGYQIVAALVTDIRLAQVLKNAMEATVTNARMKQAIQFKSEAEKLQTIKAAEGDAEAKRLSGVGLAEQRKAAILGLQESVSNFEQSVPGMSPKDIMSLLLMNQYFDAIKDIAEVSRGHTVFLPDTSGRAMEMTEGTLAAAGASATAMGQIMARRQAAAAKR
jgi:regulator of protease activity HflC (stomatin/prohibitin superfamily)